MPNEDSAVNELASLAGLEPYTLTAAVSPRLPASEAEHVPTPVPVLRMGRRSTYVPLSASELEALGEVFHVAAQARVSGSTLLNDLLRHVTDKTPWEALNEPAAARTRLRRGARTGEFAKLLEFVRARSETFCPERFESFRRLVVLEAEIVERLDQ